MCSLMAALNFPLPSDAMRAVSQRVGWLQLGCTFPWSCPAWSGWLLTNTTCTLLLFTQAGIHGHVFVNGGNLVGLSGGGRSGLRSAWRDFSTSFRWSIVSVHACLWEVSA